MKKFLSVIYTSFLLFIIVCLVVYPDRYITCSLSGIKLWAIVVLPSLLPFFFVTTLLTKTHTIANFCKKFDFLSNIIYGEGGISIYAQIMSFLSGYPVGIKIISDLKNSNVISQKSLIKMSTFCSTSGPLFVVGAVGVNMFCDKGVGTILLISHLLSSVLNGILFNFLLKRTPNKHGEILQQNSENALYETAYHTVISVLIVGTFVCVFYVLTQILCDFGFFRPFEFLLKPILFENANGFLQGILECTKGCQLLSKNAGILPIILCEGLISFGGISVILQSIIFLKNSGGSVKIFLLSKITQIILSMLLIFIILKIFYR